MACFALPLALPVSEPTPVSKPTLPASILSFHSTLANEVLLAVFTEKSNIPEIWRIKNRAKTLEYIVSQTLRKLFEERNEIGWSLLYCLLRFAKNPNIRNTILSSATPQQLADIFKTAETKL